MPADSDSIERDAVQMIEQYGGAAARIARVRAEIAEKNIRNRRLAQTWWNIVNAIERMSRAP
jgi:hypothetical protein